MPACLLPSSCLDLYASPPPQQALQRRSRRAVAGFVALVLGLAAAAGTCGWVQVGSVSYEREPIAKHANGLASAIQGNLQRSLESIGVVRSIKEQHTLAPAAQGAQHCASLPE